MLEEKKNSSIQLQVLSDDIDSHKVEIADIKKEKEDLEELLKNQASQIAKLNGSQDFENSYFFKL